MGESRYGRIISCLAALLAVSFLSACSGSSAQNTRPPEALTPLLISVGDPPVPFTGSDGQLHLAYEITLTNFSSGAAEITQAEIYGDGQLLATLDASAVASRLQPYGEREARSTMTASSASFLFLHLALPAASPPPRQLSHKINLRLAAAPDPQQIYSFSGGQLGLSDRVPVLIGPPLVGERYLAADSCCNSERHMRAALPINGKVRLAQRFAVDWEQLDAQSRIYAGAQANPASYTIYGKEALAVADARVESVVDGLPDQVPGKYPANLPLEEADGNSVILDLGNGNYALYAHLQPRSITVQPNQMVRRGQVLGLVGNSGNSVAPHLHFHVMDSPSPLASNGLPYHIQSFTLAGHSPGTAAFDAAEANGTPLAITPVTPPALVGSALPLDQSLISFSR